MAIDNLPVAIPPAGLESDFTNPPSLYPYMLLTTILCSSLTTLFSITRLCTKLMISKWAIEDCMLKTPSRNHQVANVCLPIDILGLAWVRPPSLIPRYGLQAGGDQKMRIEQRATDCLRLLTWFTTSSFSPRGSLVRAGIFGMFERMTLPAY